MRRIPVKLLIVILGALIQLFWMLTPVAAQNTVTQTVIQDTFVASNRNCSNFAGERYGVFGFWGISPNFFENSMHYIKFAPFTLPANTRAVDVKLRISVFSTWDPPGETRVSRVDQDWNEWNMLWCNRPGWTGPYGTITFPWIIANNWWEVQTFDIPLHHSIVNDVNGVPPYGVVLHNTVSNSYGGAICTGNVDSSWPICLSQHVPQLIITYDTIPNPPTGLTVTAPAGSVGQAKLTWTDNSSNEDGFRVDRSTDNVTFTPYMLFGANTTTWTDSGLTCNTPVYYRVRSYRGTAGILMSAPSNNAGVSPNCAAPTAPTNLAGIANAPGSILLTWQDASSDENYFILERSLNGTTWSSLAQPTANSTTYTNTGLACYTLYYYRIRAFRTIPNQESANSTVISVRTSDCPAPTAPSTLAGTAQAPSSIVLTWTDNSTDEANFILERSLDGTTWTNIAQPAANSTTYTNTGLTCYTLYQYRIRAFRTIPVQNSANSNVISVRSPDCPAPTAPSTLAGTAQAPSSIVLTWLDNSSDETNFIVERSPDGTTWTNIAQPAANSNTSTNAGLACYTLYYYRVRAFRTTPVQNSANSNVISVRSPDCPAPNAPTNLAGIANVPGSILLTWQDQSLDETNFILERSLDGITWTNIAQPAANSTTYTNTGLACYTLYLYRIRVVRTTPVQNSANSNVIPIRSSDCPAPNAPTNLAGIANAPGSVLLTWQDTNTDEANFILERSLDGTTWTNIAQPATNSTTSTDTGLACYTLYQYRIRAFRTIPVQNSANSTAISVRTSDCPGPVAPTNLAGTAQAPNSIVLTWQDNSSDEAYFTIERSLNGTTWTNSGQAAANTTTWTNPGLACYTLYYYRIRAYRALPVYDSANSNVISVRTSDCPAPTAPSTLAGTAQAPSSIVLTWTDNSTDEANFIVERSLDGTTWTNIAQPAANSTTYTNTGLTCYTLYQYRIRAFRTIPVQNSANSAVISVRSPDCPAPIAPTTLAGTAQAPSSIVLTWQDKSLDETNFIVERSLDGTTWTNIAQPAANSTTYTNTGLTCYTLYQYRIRAFRTMPTQDSANSTVISVRSSDCPAPTVPSNVQVAPEGARQLRVTWSDNSTDETAFRIERQSGAQWTQVGTVASGVTSYLDTNLGCYATHTYRIVVYRELPPVQTAISTSASGRTQDCPTPLAPTDVQISALTADRIEIDWQDTNTDETQYLVERSPDGVGNWTQLAPVPANSTTTTDLLNLGMSCDRTFYYRVRTFRQTPVQHSAYTTPVSVASGPCFMFDPAYVFEQGADYANPSKAKIAFYSGQPIAYVLRLHKRIRGVMPIKGRWIVEGNGQQFPIEQTSGSATDEAIKWRLWMENKFANFPVGTYQVRGFISVSNVEYEVTPVTIQVYKQAVPTVSTVLNPYETNQVLMQWQPVSHTQDYKITLTGSLPATQIIPVQGTQYSTPLADGLYSWQVRAVDADGDLGPLSTVIKFRLDTIPPQPSVPTAPINSAKVNTSRPTLQWTASPSLDVTRYEVRIGSSSAPDRVYTTPAATSWTVPTPLLTGLNYWQVRALDRANNPSPWSAVMVMDIRANIIVGPVFTTPQPTLTWKGVSWATEYAIRITYDKDGNTPVANASVSGGLTETEYDVPVALMDGVYYWQIGFRQGTANWQWTKAVPFVIDAP